MPNATAEVETFVEFDQRAFRRCLGQYATGVTLITTEHDGKRAGIAANSFSSLSLDPPLILWSIARTSRSFDTFQVASHFAINILAAGQVQDSQTFSSSTDDKFAGGDWAKGLTGSPVLTGAVGVIDCAVEARHDAGDHVLVIGRVLDFRQFDGDPLVFSQGRYAVAGPHPALAEKEIGRDDAAPTPEGLDHSSLWRLVFSAQQALSRSFEEHRREAGYAAPQGPILIALSRPLPRSELAERSFLAPAVFEDNLSELRENGIVRIDDGTVALTPKGEQRRAELKRHLVAFEAEQWSGAREEEIASARSFLMHVVRKHMPMDWPTV